MNSRNSLLLFAVGLAMFGISFQAGRSIELPWDSAPDLNPDRLKEQSGKSVNDHDAPTPAVTLEAREFGHTAFSEMYRTMQSASRPMRLAWAKEIEQMKIGPQRASAVCSYYKTLVQIDPRTAAQAAVDIQDRLVRQIAIGALIGAAPTSAMEDLAKVLIQSPPDPRRVTNYTLGDVISEWSAVDPLAVAKFLDQTKNDQVAGCLPPLLQNWGNIDPEAAEKWLERRDPSEQTTDVISALLSGWSSRDRTTAAKFLITHSADERFLPSIQRLSYSMFLEDPDGAREFLGRLSNESVGLAVDNIVTNALTPEAAGKGPEAKRSAETMAKWVVSLPPEMWSEMTLLTTAWETEDSGGFTNWLNQLPLDTRDHVLSEYCAVIRPDTAERKISFALEITDPEVREQTLKMIVGNLGSSPEELGDALRNTGLSAATKAYLKTLAADE